MNLIVEQINKWFGPFQAHLNPNLIVEAALQHGGIISRFEVVEPSLTDIFMELVGTTALPDALSALPA